MLIIIIWVFIAFSLGAVPFSVLLTQAVLGKNIRAFGDGNPGATNAWKAGGWQLGISALLLDALKGAVPVLLAQILSGISGWGLFPIGLAPILGHAYSPALNFKGGKSLATTFGVWTGLTLGEIPIILGLFLAFFLWLLDSDAWAVVLGFSGVFVHLVTNRPEPLLLSIMMVNGLLVVWKYRNALSQAPRVRWHVKQQESVDSHHA